MHIILTLANLVVDGVLLVAQLFCHIGIAVVDLEFDFDGGVGLWI